MTATHTDAITPEIAAERAAILEKMSASGGSRLEDKPRQDYFGNDVSWKYMLPDGVSYIEHKKFSEGDLRKYRNGTNRDVTINRTTKDARVRLAAGDDRHMLLDIAISGWDLIRGGLPFAYTPKNRATLLSEFDSDIFDGLIKDINAKNPSLRSDVTAQDLRDEIVNLQELLTEKEAEEAGEASSSS